MGERSPVLMVDSLPQRYNVPGAARTGSVTSSGVPRVAALDGLRGLAIAGVVAFHIGILPGGFLGVDLFFVLSGYLITGILLRERERTSRVVLREFWIRRARRLVPAVIVLVIAAQLWARTSATPAELEVVNGQSVAAMVYASNWYNILFHVGYWSAGLSRSPLNHLWSLGIEEQFYVVFPLLFVLLCVYWKLNARAFGVIAALLAALSLALAPLLFASQGANRAYFGTDSRAAAILIGSSLAAFLFSRKKGSGSTQLQIQDAPSAALHDHWLLRLGAMAALIVIVTLWAVASTSAPFLYRGGLALHALSSALLIAVISQANHGALLRVFEWRPLVWLGERSYSLYLWHWPLLVVLTTRSTGLSGIALAGAITAAITVATIASYELVEHPIRYSNLRGVRLVTVLTVPAVCIAVSALFFQPAPPPQFGTDALFTTGHGVLRVMIVGDSWARNLGIALAKVDSTHRVTVVNMGKGGCGIADAKRERSAVKGDYETPPDCLTWHITWPAVVKSVKPQVAILSVGNWDQAPQDFEGNGAFVGACDANFARHYATQLDRAIAVLGERGARVLIMNVRDNDGRAGSGPDCMNRLLETAVARHADHGVQLLDLYAQLCARHVCPDSVSNERVYDETGHLTADPERRIARWILNRAYEVQAVRSP